MPDTIAPNNSYAIFNLFFDEATLKSELDGIVVPTTGESSMRCGPSFQLCLRDDGESDNDAGLPPGRMSISNWGPSFVSAVSLA